MKKVIFLLILLFLISLTVAIFQRNPSIFKMPFAKNTTATINKQVFVISVAKTPKEKQIGLSEKKSLPQNEGMLFPFEKSDYYFFWMKNMKFPIDIIFIDKNHVVTVYQNSQPPKSKDENLTIYKPEEPANMVLEINAGISKKYNIKKNDEVKIENL